MSYPFRLYILCPFPSVSFHFLNTSPQMCTCAYTQTHTRTHSPHTPQSLLHWSLSTPGNHNLFFKPLLLSSHFIVLGMPFQSFLPDPPKPILNISYFQDFSLTLFLPPWLNYFFSSLLSRHFIHTPTLGLTTDTRAISLTFFLLLFLINKVGN